MDKSLAKGLVNRIMRKLHHQFSEPDFVVHGSHRKQCRAVLARCKERSSATLISQRFKDTKNWEVIWGEWVLFSSKASLNAPRMPIESYDKIAFDLTFTNPKTSMGAGVFFVELSRHSLLRLIMRCGHEVKTPSDLWKFLQRITRQLLFAALELSRYNSGANDEGYTLDEYKAIANGLSPQTQQYIIIDGFYIPLSYTIKPNKFGGVSRVVTVKTFMPEEYESSKRALENEKPLTPGRDFFDYTDVFPFLKNNIGS